jgi:hypothetical protein
MTDVVSKKCQCGKHVPIFGLVEGNPTHCKECKSADMTDVVSKKCQCGKHKPTFGLVEGKPTHCKECRSADMTDVVSKKCQCGKHQASFGLVKGKYTHCKECKSADMTDVKSKKCECGNHVVYGSVEGKPTHCKECKSADMTNVTGKKCECGTYASFGLVEGKPTHCAKCAVKDKIISKQKLQASKAACKCFDTLSEMTGIQFKHVHMDHNGDALYDHALFAEEPRGLVPAKHVNFRPDCYIEELKTVVLFHGNHWHGWPPGHAKHLPHVKLGNKKTSMQAFQDTVADMKCYVDAGFCVWYVFEHEWRTNKSKSVVCELHKNGFVTFPLLENELSLCDQ